MDAYATTYSIGGVMRCCIGSLEEYIADHPEVEDGTEVLCKYESDPKDSGFVLRGTHWRVRRFEHG